MVRHGLGIAIFSVLSAVSLSVIGCGGTGSGMGVLEPFPTGTSSTPTGTSTPVPPTPDEPDNVAYDVVNNKDLRNPVYQYVDDSNNVYTVQGFTVGATGMSDQQCKYRLLKYSTTDKEADPQEVTINIRNANGGYTKGDLANPYYITGIIDSMGTVEDRTDDRLYLAVTDLGTTKAVYLMDLGARAEGWKEARAVNVFDCGTNLKATCPLTCSFGSSSFNREEDAINTLFYTDYSDTGTVKFIAFDEKIFNNGKPTDKLSGNVANCGNVFTDLTLNYPAVIKANEGPWVTVTCQGNSRVYFFANNDSLTDFKGDSKYPLANVPKYVNYIQPENAHLDLQNPYDFAWASGVADNEGEESQYLTIASGFALDKYGKASSAYDKGALWIYKFDSTKYADSLQNLRNNDGEYTLILDELQYPVNVTFTNPLDQSDKRYLDIAYLTTGTSTSYNVKDLRGTLSFCRYDAKSKKLVNKSDVDLLEKIADPFGLVALPGTLAESSYPVQFLFTTHWNWNIDFTEKSHIYSYSKTINLEAGE